MSDEADPAVLAAYRAAATETPGAALDAAVLAARPRRAGPTDAIVWAQAAGLLLAIAGALVLAARPAGPPDEDDPRFYGLYAGREQSELMALGADATALMTLPVTPKEPTDG